MYHRELDFDENHDSDGLSLNQVFEDARLTKIFNVDASRL